VQKLDVVERLFPLVLSGEKTSTVRYRERRIHVGTMVYWCDGNSEITSTVWVKQCTDLPLLEVAEFLSKLEEWPDEIMLEGMRVHYPEIQLTDIVQVIEHYDPKESLLYLSKIDGIE
jgi:hypothetical protein